ncbi:MAG: FliG C-terminal domain-containing protein [Elusimicrobiota bacterium]
MGVILLLCVLIGFCPETMAQSMMEQKLALESSIQERTERIVEKIIGSRETVVLVNVELATEKSKTERPLYPGMTGSQEEYLPGITYSYVPLDLEAAGYSNVTIKKINISITVDTKITTPVVDRIKKEITSLMGLNTLRGDVVDVQKIVFSSKKINWGEQLLNLFSNLYWIAVLGLIALFLFGPLRNFFKTIVKAMEIRIDADTKIRNYDDASRAGIGGGNPFMPSGPIELTLDRKRPQLKKGEEEQMKMKKFGFIDANNLKNLIFLLKEEKPEKIAILTSYLSSEFTSQVINSLPPKKQAQVALTLTMPRIIDPQEVDELEKEMKQKIDYLVGGDDYFMNLLDQVDIETQENILQNLEGTNPALATKIRQVLFFFNDIVILDKQVLQKVIREIQKQGLSLALALKGAADGVKSKVMETLTEGARAMLAEQIDLLGDVTEKRAQDEQKQIAIIIKQLERAGEIIIDRGKKFNIIDEDKSTAVVPEEVNGEERSI